MDRLDQLLVEQRQAHDQLAARVSDGFAAIARKERNAGEFAEQWLRDSRVIIEHIDTSLRHRKFAPGAMETLRTALARSEENVARGVFEAAIATAQALYADALRVQADIEFRQMQWDAWFAEVQTSSRKLLAEIAVQEAARWVFGVENSENEMKAEIDYWSDGALTRLKTAIHDDLRRCEQTEDVDTETLQTMARNNADRHEDLRLLVEKARDRLFASVMRISLAQDVAEQLATSGWNVKEGTWQGAETDAKGGERNSYHLKFTDVADNEIVTVILPEEDERGDVQNRIQFAYFPKDMNDARFAGAQTAILNRTLREMGAVDGSELTCVAGHERTTRGDEARRDFATVKRVERQQAGQAARTSGNKKGTGKQGRPAK
jgi:hypothetical protein